MTRRLISASVLAAAALSTTAHADVMLSLVSASSSLTISGDASGAPLNPQGAGADVTSYSGSISISDPGASFSFLSADMDAANSGSWSPLPGGAVGNAPANYGLRAMILALTINGAVRNLEVGLSSGAIPLAGGSFAASLATLGLQSGQVDFNSGVSSGSQPVAGLTAAAGAAMGSLTVVGNDVTLTLPVNATFMTTAGGLPVNLNLRGTIVATGQIPAPAGASVFAGVILLAARRRRGGR